MTDKITLPIKVLLSAIKKLQTTFTAEELAIACWEEYPEDFGLRGYHDKHPDSNRIYTHIMSNTGFLAKNGYYVSLGQKKYKITDKGRNFAYTFTKDDVSETNETKVSRQALDRNVLLRIKKLVKSSFWKKSVIKKEIDSIRFFEFFTMLGITSAASSQQLNNKVNELDELLAVFHRFKTNIIIDDNKNLTMSAEHIKLFENAKNMCFKKFDDELSTIRKRNRVNSR